MGYPLRLYTTPIKCAASTSSTRLVSSATPGKDYQAITIQAANANSGTIYVSGNANATRRGFPLTKGQSLDIGPTAMGGMTWHGIDPNSVIIWSTAGTAQYVIFHYLAR